MIETRRRFYSRQAIPVYGPGGAIVSIQGTFWRAIWVDCPIHGAQMPAIVKKNSGYDIEVPWEAPWIVPTEELRYVHSEPRQKVACLPCGVCGGPSPYREIKERLPRPGKGKTQCGGACLAGKISCDCRCGGRCHGAGVCSC